MNVALRHYNPDTRLTSGEQMRKAIDVPAALSPRTLDRCSIG